MTRIEAAKRVGRITDDRGPLKERANRWVVACRAFATGCYARVSIDAPNATLVAISIRSAARVYIANALCGESVGALLGSAGTLTVPAMRRASTRVGGAAFAGGDGCTGRRTP